MRKSLRIIAITAGLTLLSAVLLAVVLPHLLDPNAYKDRISALVKARTGHELIIDGDIKLSLLPWLALEVSTVQLSNAPGFDATPLLRAGHGALRIKLLPLLLQQKVELDQISLDDVVVHLQRDAQGQGNWRSFAGTSAVPPSAGGNAPEMKSSAALALLQLGKVELHNARADWDDRRAGRYYQFSDINVITTRYTPGRPFTIGLQFAVSPARNAPAWPVRLLATVNADPAAQHYTLDKAKLTLGPIQGLTARLISSADLDFARQRLTLPDIELRVADLKLTGQLQAQQILDNPDLRGVLSLAEFNPRPLLQALDKMPPHAEAGVLQRVSGSFALQAGRDQIILKPLAVRLDDTAVSGELSVRNFTQPHWGFALEVDTINVDRYFPPPAESPTSVTPSTPLPIEFLRRANVEGSIHIARLQGVRLRSSDVRLTIKSPTGAEPPTGTAPVPSASAQVYQHPLLVRRDAARSR
ncbi:MAG: AsmA family protein [Gammaproteobacteria bacterium]